MQGKLSWLRTIPVSRETPQGSTAAPLSPSPSPPAATLATRMEGSDGGSVVSGGGVWVSQHKGSPTRK